MSDVSDEDVERWSGAARWSAAPELTSMQTLLWRAERHPVQSSTSTVVIDLDRAPDWDRFVAATEWGTRLVRRLRQRVVEPIVPTAAPDQRSTSSSLTLLMSGSPRRSSGERSGGQEGRGVIS